MEVEDEFPVRFQLIPNVLKGAEGRALQATNSMDQHLCRGAVSYTVYDIFMLQISQLH